MSELNMYSGLNGVRTAAVFLSEGLEEAERVRKKAAEIIGELIDLAEHGDADLDEGWNEALNRARSFICRDIVVNEDEA